MTETRYNSPITETERKTAEDSWPTLTQADLDNVKLPKGMTRVDS